MRKISTDEINKQVYNLCAKANFELDEDILCKFKENAGNEVIADLARNAELASKNKVAICQDTGFVLVFIELGQEVNLEGGDLKQAVNEGVAKAYEDCYLRKSVLNDPLQRKNTGNNTPAIFYTDIVPGDKVKITVVPKGGGSENKSALKMLTPADGKDGVVSFVLDTVKKAGADACPPYVIGVGIGGTFDHVGLLAKKALLRKLGQAHQDKETAELEEVLLAKINGLNIGPAGFGGSPTALAVQIETFPCHIASLPVAVNIGCHVNRHASAII
ncbi:MAG: fumarate hydratase [Candidatus Margulisiibacteriota bacterium]|jgi:fumarate hydratase subunit alpha